LQEKRPGPVPALITAEIKGQEIGILTSNIDSLTVLLNDSLLDLDKPVTVLWKGSKVFDGAVPRTLANLYRTVQERGDQDYAYSATLKVGKSGTGKTNISRAAGAGLRHPIPDGKAGSDLTGRYRPGKANWVWRNGVRNVGYAMGYEKR
jgi:hypothetical protein